MDDQKIVRVVDALRSQQRVILWLACKHTLSITQAQWVAAQQGDLPTVGEVVQCPFCPDPPAEDPRVVKSAQQLWREAGEP